MIVECSHCHTKYNVDEAKIPAAGVKVRCKQCKNIIVIKKEEPQVEPAVPETPPSPTAEEPREEAQPPSAEQPAPTEVPIQEEPKAAEPSTAAAEPAPPEEVPKAEEEAPVAPEEEPQAAAPIPPGAEPPMPEQPTEEPKLPGPEIPKPPEPELPPDAEKAQIVVEPSKPALPEMSEEDKKWHERARRLAKALASDLILYNKDKVAQGLSDGTLAQLLGSEIRRSWEYYCQQIPKHIIDSTDYFKEQLNRIVGKGKEIFK